MNVDPPENPDHQPSQSSPHFQLPLSRHQEVVPLIPWQGRHFRRIDLPPQFPETVASPKYAFGTQCRWMSKTYCDRGTVIGQVYAPDEREDPIRWSWVYLLLLHPHSPSWEWIVADWVDEEDLEPFYPVRST